MFALFFQCVFLVLILEIDLTISMLMMLIECAGDIFFLISSI